MAKSNPNQNSAQEENKPKSNAGFPGMGLPETNQKPKTSQQVGEARRLNSEEPNQHKDRKRPF
jgi:hypothetical protein